jgi:hypothetical protein
MFSKCYPILNKSVVLILIIIEAFMFRQLICNFLVVRCVTKYFVHLAMCYEGAQLVDWVTTHE